MSSSAEQVAAVAEGDSAQRYLGHLLELIYQGGDEVQPWSGALGGIQTGLRASWAALLLRPATEHLPARLVTAGGPLWLAGDSPRLAGHRCPPGEPFQDLAGDHVQRLPDFGRGGRASRHVIGADIRVTPDVRVRLRICRIGKPGPFSARDLEYAELLLPHFRRALHGYFISNRREQENDLLSHALERLGLGLVILDGSGAVLNCNRNAAEILRRGNGLRLDKAALACEQPADERRLRGVIKTMLQRATAGGSGEGMALAVTRGDGSSRLGLLLQPLCPGPLGEGRRRPAVAVFLRDAHGGCQPAPRAVSQLFDLTPVETRLALAMANDATLDEAAALLAIRRNTARTHLRSIFAKVGVQRQASLLRVILNSVAVMTS